jgi:hypothetical protein
MKTCRCSILVTLVLSILCFAMQPSKTASDPKRFGSTISQVTGNTGEHSLNEEDVGAFFDGFISMQMERSDIAGAEVLVMRDGRVLRKLEDKEGYPPSETGFRVASISWAPVL